MQYQTASFRLVKLDSLSVKGSAAATFRIAKFRMAAISRSRVTDANGEINIEDLSLAFYLCRKGAGGYVIDPTEYHGNCSLAKSAAGGIQ